MDITGWSDASRFPRASFVDDEVFAAEQEHLFPRSWQMVAHESELEAPGDFVRRKLFTDDVIVTRARDGELHVLLNSCTHRGTQLCKVTNGTATSFKCGYHGWTFDGSGRLIGVPGLKTSYSQDFDKAEHALREARVEVLHGLVFANWDPEAPPLTECLGEFAWYLDALLSISDGGWEAYGPPVHYLRQGNWKLEAENFVGDGYHLPNAHRSMYDLGVMGRDAESERAVAGHCVSTPEGNGLRTVHLDVEVDGRKPFLGFPPDRHDEIEANLGERTSLLAGNTVIHGTVFPNTSFIKVSLHSVGDEGDDWTAYVMFRVPVPVSAHTTHLYQWVLVPRDYPEEWRDRSYTYAMRSHGPAQVFEVDDIENMSRIDVALSGALGGIGELDYSLGKDIDAEEPGWTGPGDVDPQNASEHNQRAYYRRWLDVVGGN